MNTYSTIFKYFFTVALALVMTSSVLTAQTLQLNFSQVPPACFGYTNGTATAIPAGGTGPYAYQWDNGQRGETNYGLSGGTYSVTVTDQTGRTVTGSVTVQQPGALTVSVTSDGAACQAATSLTANATGGTGNVAFTWSNGSAGASTPVNNNVTYHVTATDANGCINVGTYNVRPALDVQLKVNNTPCGTQPNSSMIGASVAGGTYPFTYNWSNGTSDPALQNIPAGTYTITVRDASGCSVVKSAAVVVPSVIDVTIVTIRPACGGANGSATISASGGTPPYRHVWSSGHTGTTATGLAPGQYYVCTFDANNCQHDIFITIPDGGALNLNLVAKNAPCLHVSNGSATIEVTPAAGNYTYTWNVPGASNTNTLNGLAPGTTVSVTVTESTTGCEGRATGVIGADAGLTLAVTKQDIPCQSTALGSATATTAGAVGGVTYTWTLPNGTTRSDASLTGLSAGTYRINAIDGAGCKDSSGVEILQKGVELKVNDVVAACGATEAILTATAAPGTTFQWFDPTGNLLPAVVSGNTSSVTVAAGTDVRTYRVSADNAGCTDSRNVQVRSEGTLPDLQLKADTTSICEGKSVTWSASIPNSSGNISYQWTANGLTIVGGNSSSVQLNGPAGEYIVKVEGGQSGCMASKTARLTIAGNPTLTIANPGPVCLPRVNLSASATAGASITWFDDKNNQVASGPVYNAPSGTYRVEATVAPGCAASTFTEAVSRAVSASLEGAGALCAGDTVAWRVRNGRAGDILQYSWSASGVTLSSDTTASALLSVSNGGLYVVKVLVKNQFGCMSEVQAPLSAQVRPLLTLDKDTLFACNNSIELSAAVSPAGTPVVWENAITGVIAGTGNTVPVAVGTAQTVYRVRAGLQGCSAEKTVAVVPSKAEVAFSTDNPAGVCPGNNAIWKALNANPNGTDSLRYVWSASNGVSIANGTTATATLTAAPGTYSITVTATNKAGCTAQKTDKFVVSNPDVWLVQNTICTCDSFISFVALSNSQTNQVTWYNMAGDSLATGLVLTRPVAGDATYTVRAKDAYGCVAADTARVIDSAIDARLDAGNPAVTCDAVSLQWGVINNNPKDSLSYVWSGPNGVVFSNPNGANTSVSAPAGNHTIKVTVTSRDKCCKKELTASLKVNEKTDANISITKNACDDRTVSFASVSMLAGRWSFGDGKTDTTLAVQHTYTQAGEYTVIFQPKDPCVRPVERKITVSGQPALQAAIGNNLQKCTENAEIKFTDLTKASAAIQSWNWSFTPGAAPSAQQNPTVIFPGGGPITATLIVQDVNGCKDTASVELKADVVNESVAQNLDFCTGGSVQLNPDMNPSYTYAWTATPNDPALQTTAANPTVSPTVPTTYRVVVKNGQCEVQYEALVTPKERIPVSLPADKTLCDNKPVLLQATAPGVVSFDWSQSRTFSTVLTGKDTLTVNPANGTTTYYVRAGGNAQCTGVDSIRIVRAPVQIEGVPQKRKLCFGNETELNVTNLDPRFPVKEYAWTHGLPAVSNPKVTPPVGTTIYAVTATNTVGCTQTLSFEASVIDVSVEARTDRDTLCFGQTAQLNATAQGASQYTYSWVPSATLTRGDISNPIAQPEEDMLYTVVVTGDDLCQATATVSIVFLANQCVEPYIFVPKAFTPNGDDNNDYFIVRGVNIKDLYFVVWNRWGEKMFETEDVNSKGWDGSFGGKELTPDSYSWYVRVTCGNGATYIKKGDVTLLK